jgi:phospholipid/cholesterol/gamma-HCH transport system permease protein
LAHTLTKSHRGRLEITHADADRVSLVVGGAWSTAEGRPAGFDAAVDRVTSGGAFRRLEIVAESLDDWDTSLVSAIRNLADAAAERGAEVTLTDFPDGVTRLIALVDAVPEKSDARRGEGDITILERIGQATIFAGDAVQSTISFMGEVVIALGRIVTGRGIFRWGDLAHLMQRAGIEALGIAVLVSYLLGLILAFIGAIQFERYGASIYVADLVGIGMVRDMAALMTAIVMAGRSGALVTSGISPVEFLVVPRILAIAAMMPLLVIFADVAGILGGATVGLGMLDLSPTLYFEQTVRAVTPAHLYGGLIKGFAYGILVGVAGCLRGIQSGSSSLAVGAAATSAVVTGLVWIIAACGLFQVLQYVLGI